MAPNESCVCTMYISPTYILYLKILQAAKKNDSESLTRLLTEFPNADLTAVDEVRILLKMNYCFINLHIFYALTLALLEFKIRGRYWDDRYTTEACKNWYKSVILFSCRTEKPPCTTAQTMETQTMLTRCYPGGHSPTWWTRYEVLSQFGNNCISCETISNTCSKNDTVLPRNI